MKQHAFIKKQRGMATIMIVLLVGVGLTAASVATIYSVRNVQENQIAVHAATHAQNSLWTATEAFRQYINNLPAASLTSLNGDVDIILGANYGTIKATNIVVTTVGSNYQVATNIISTNTAAKSSAAINVVYEVQPGSGGGSVGLTSAINFFDDLLIEGDVVFDSTTSAELVSLGSQTISVKGNISVANVSLENVDNINSTGNVYINSAVEVGQIYANGEVTLDGSAKADSIYALSDINVVGGNSYVGEAWTNANANMAGYGTNNSGALRNHNSLLIQAIGDINILKGNTHGRLVAGGNIMLGDPVTSGYVSEVEQIEAVGDINMRSGGVGDIGSVKGEGNIDCGNIQNRKVAIGGSVNGTTTNCPAKIVGGGSNGVSVMAPLAPFQLNDIIVDVYTLKDAANYVVEYDSSVSKTKVTVKDVNGITDGVYVVGTKSLNGSYLCDSVDGSGNCTNIDAPPLCLGFRPETVCLTKTDYDSSTGFATWMLEGSGTAPGVYWFDGHLRLSSGRNTATVLATGNVTTAGLFRQWAVNYLGYDEVCTAAGVNVADYNAEMGVIYKTWFEHQYPTNLCDIGTTTYSPITVGNIAIASGGYSDGTGTGTYVGGNIVIETNNEVYGAVMAGNYLETLGSSNINGFMTAAGLGEEREGTENRIGARTAVTINEDIASYSPSEIPDMSSGGGGAGGAGVQTTTVLWTRYL